MFRNLNGPYQVIYCDPPWAYKDKASAGKRGAEFKYPVMSHEGLAKMPVADLADSDAGCLLFMWVTWPQLPNGLALMREWGFEYKTVAFNWIKTNSKATDTVFWGMGNWTRSNSEIVLLGVRKGKQGLPGRVSKSVHSVVEWDDLEGVVRSPIRRHSEKPECVRDAIVELVGDVPRVELFSRHYTEGWDVWGDEVYSTQPVRKSKFKRIEVKR